MTRALVIFLDGVGIGGSEADINPFVTAGLATLDRLLGSRAPLLQPSVFSNEHATLLPLDATLGVAGLPQSGTGQTALFTGINAAHEFGRHFGPWVPTSLRDRLAQENFLTKAKASGCDAAFANAYPEELFRGRSGHTSRMPDPLRAGPPIAALGAGVLTRHTPELTRGDAVASEITNESWRLHLQRTELPVITAAQAGTNLARIAAAHDITLFAHYATDYVGHRNNLDEAVAALEKVDGFLGGLLADATTDTCVAIVSDHGNLEDVRVGHTLNPALGLFIGSRHEHFTGLTSIADVAPALLRLLDAPAA